MNNSTFLTPNMNFMTLQNGLSKFGLNPSQWLVKESGPSEFIIQSTDDQDFAFLGKTHDSNQKPEWQSIVLFSL